MGRFVANIFLVASCALFILPLLRAAEQPIIYNVSPRTDIVELEPGAAASDLGVVNGVRQCGGTGQMVQWRYEPCNGEVPCRIPGDGKRKRSEYEFIPSNDISMLGVRFNVITETGPHTVHDRPITNSAVKEGTTYVQRGAGGPPKEMVGRNFTFQRILYRVDNGQVETCSEADFQVVEP